eukprot:GHVR01101960.1.p1 GENE.GHVR01101960.1~~GHVR01101960.1.p1  ORF type:complete len:213 (+),score=21.71 GHVR01101960.1:1-639(+)
METTHKKSRIYIYTMMALLYVLPGMISGLSQIAIINKIVVLRIMGHRIPLNTPKELTENLKETIMGPGFFVIAVLVCMNVASWLYISIINTIPVQKKIIWVCSDSLRLRHTDVISKIFEDPWDKLYLHHLGENVSFDPKDKRISEAELDKLKEERHSEVEKRWASLLSGEHVTIHGGRELSYRDSYGDGQQYNYKALLDGKHRIVYHWVPPA